MSVKQNAGEHKGSGAKALNKIIYLHYRTGMREMAPIGEMAPGCAKKYKKEIFKHPFAPGAISRMITVVRPESDALHRVKRAGFSKKKWSQSSKGGR